MFVQLIVSTQHTHVSLVTFLLLTMLNPTRTFQTERRPHTMQNTTKSTYNSNKNNNNNADGDTYNNNNDNSRSSSSSSSTL
uniref:Uncharacterized protein n=1 Tax=Glossina morsitans morsitans TaxID=37546 RepID=A0ABK9NFV7_GLOMM